ncbi:sugar phosphate isomerase/epimerase family protein [Caballeronia ptereochthonis]|uniref:Xylose isomerase domain-containing protein n=1 Tax=Caballeronia ptereochthonis TaxID=1777144 RepID=A0A158D8W4_9BURK|nr:TIM barrel protein [Caballeronia ptereochthonis]SAK91112.1 xylose isomerase domain-containing protein [Caballeronia ptereochthonis]
MKSAPIAARPLAVAHLTALDIAPVPWVRLAARAGFDAVGLRVHPAVPGAVAYPTAPGTAAHRELQDALAGEGIAVHDVEFIPVVPELDPASFARLFESAASLGAHCVNVSGDDPEQGRLADNLAALAELARPFGLRIDLEFMRWRHVGSLAHAREMVARVAHPNLAVLIDALHLSRSGGTPDEVGGMPPGWIGSAQLCDARSEHPGSDDEAIREARTDRLPPGAGALPLDALLRALPADVALSVEMPFPSVPVDARLDLAYSSARRVVDRLGAVTAASV